MGVERVDYYSEDEYEQALYEESRATGDNNEPNEPPVIPCFRCGGQMYEESPVFEENICAECKKKGMELP